MKTKGIVALLAFSGAIIAHANPPGTRDLDRPYDQYTWLTTHNSFNVGHAGNQSRSISAQLADGVRGLMIDIHDKDGRGIVCHTCLTEGDYFADVLNKEVIPFLERDPTAIVALHLDDYVSRDVLNRELDNVPGLAPLVFDPDDWNTPQWPTLQQMIDRGQRLLIFDLQNEHPNAGHYHTPEGNVRVMASDEATVENYWSLGFTQWMHDFSCYSRWTPRIPLTTGQVAWKDKTWSRLFVMNQFHGLAFARHAEADNKLQALTDRFENYCFPAAGRKPNYVAVDQYERGDGMEFVKALNEGTIGPQEY